MAPPEALEENGFPSLLQLTETPVFLDRSPTFLTPRTDFVDDFSTDLGWGEGWFRMIQGHYIYCALSNLMPLLI